MTKWQKNIPSRPGWYWLKCRRPGQKRQDIIPAQVRRLRLPIKEPQKSGPISRPFKVVVRLADGNIFSSRDRMKSVFASAKFGPALEAPYEHANKHRHRRLLNLISSVDIKERSQLLSTIEYLAPDLNVKPIEGELWRLLGYRQRRRLPKNPKKPFKNFMGEIVDLADPGVCGEAYRHASWGEVHLACIKQLGYALVYLKYLNPEPLFAGQLKEVEKLCEELAANENAGPRDNGAAGRNPNVQYWKDLLYRIEDETENLC